jgi:hypothetical protein
MKLLAKRWTMRVLRIPTAILASCVAVRTIVNQKDPCVSLVCGCHRGSRADLVIRRGVGFLYSLLRAPEERRATFVELDARTLPLRSRGIFA